MIKPLPRDIEAEQSVLGCIFIDPTVIDEVRDSITSPEDFYDARHATIYHAILDIIERERTVDVVMLTGKLLDMGALEQVGGASYIASLVEFVPGTAGVGYYAGRVAEKALRRRTIEQGENTLKALYTGDASTASLIDSSVNRLIDMRPAEYRNSAKLDYWLQEAMEDDKPGIDSGLAALDNIVEGFESGSYVVIGARPSMGKTALGISTALGMAQVGIRVGFCSAEMSGRRIARRFVCADARISTKEFDKQKRTADIQSVIQKQNALPLWIDQTPGAHIDKVCGRIRRWKREHDIQAVFVDYLQILGTSIEKEYDAVTDASRKLNALKGELDITVFALAQLNRGNTQRQDKRPAMADLRGSGAVEQDADIILMLHRESYYKDGQDILDGKDKDDEAQILVEKNRDGRTGTANVGWIGKCGLFTSGIPSDVFAGI